MKRARRASETFDLARSMVDMARVVDAEIDRILEDVRELRFYKPVHEYLELGKRRLRPSFAVYEPIRHVIEAGGKRVRPTLCLLACQAVGGDMERALPTAAAIELLHTFTLIHDDVMDQDRVRRGRPTVAAVWGDPIAITAGDGLFALAFHAIAENAKADGVRRETVLRILGMASETCLGLCQGQTLDLLLEKEARPTVEQYLEMIRLKTGVLLEFALRSGALLGGGTEAQVVAIGQFGSPLGMAFQIQDDLLNLVGNERVIGKPHGGDIRRGKRTLLVVHALEHAAPKDQKRLRAILDARGKRVTRAMVEEAIRILDRAGSLAYAQKKADELVHQAKGYLGSLPESEASHALRALHEMADFVIHREK